MKKPNLFIVGAARSGTTSLWQYLKTHPDIYMPEDELLKEPTYFSNNERKLTLDSYLSLFEPAGHRHKWIGEASVAYITDPESAKRIHAFDPAAKIIIMLRNPADRAYSLYNWMVQDGYEYAFSFEEALKLEEIRVHQRESDWYKPNYYWGYLYFRSGLYHDQVKRYLEVFKENVLVTKFEDFVKNPAPSYEEICSFLQISSEHISFHIHNPSYAVRSAKILFILRKLNNYIIKKNKQGTAVNTISKEIQGEYQDIVNKLSQVTRLSIYEKILGRRTAKKVADHLKKLSEPYPYKEIKGKKERDQLLTFGLKPDRPAKLNKKTRMELFENYQTDIKCLSDLTRIDFSDWWVDACK